MPRSLGRLLLHSVHVLTFALLLSTGILMLSPELRSAVTGGYSLVLYGVHCWGGVAFVALPLLVVVASGGPAVLAPETTGRLRRLWQSTHMAVTVGFAVAFTATGLALWVKDSISQSTADLSFALHNGLTYAAGLLVALHVVEVAGSGMAARLQEARSAGTSSSNLPRLKED